MAGIDDVLERIVTDTEFRHQLSTDPHRALAGYDLTDDEMELVTLQLSTDAGAAGGMEQRITKSTMVGLLALAGDLIATEPTAAASSPNLHEFAVDGNSPTPDLPVEEVTFVYQEIKVEYPSAGGEPGDLVADELPPEPAVLEAPSDGGEAADTHELEEVSFTYQKIELEQAPADGEPGDLAADELPPVPIELENVRITSYSISGSGGPDEPELDLGTEEQSEQAPAPTDRG